MNKLDIDKIRPDLAERLAKGKRKKERELKEWREIYQHLFNGEFEFLKGANGKWDTVLLKNGGWDKILDIIEYAIECKEEE